MTYSLLQISGAVVGGCFLSDAELFYLYRRARSLDVLIRVLASKVIYKDDISKLLKIKPRKIYQCTLCFVYSKCFLVIVVFC